MSETAPESEGVDAPEGDEGQANQTFTQKQVNDLLADQKRKVQARFKDYDSLKERAARADALDHELSSETEKAAAKARSEATEATRNAFVPRLVKAEFRSEARAHGITTEQVEAILEDVNLLVYVDEDGEPDLKKIQRKIAAIAPKEPERPNFPDLGGGKRGASPSALNMNDLIRAASGRA